MEWSLRQGRYGSNPVGLDLPDIAMPEIGEYARGVMLTPGQLTIKVSAASMADADRDVFAQVNAMEPLKRAQLHEQDNDLYEDCGWAWTPDYRLVKAAPGLTR